VILGIGTLIEGLTSGTVILSYTIGIEILIAGASFLRDFTSTSETPNCRSLFLPMYSISRLIELSF
jgi:hypothetical protein